MKRINVTIEELRSFLVVAELKNFRQAAEQLNISQPALSRRIAKVENALDTLLIERTTRTVELTNVGARMLPKLNSIVNDATDILGEIERERLYRQSVVSVACVPSMVPHFMPMILGSFNAHHPEIKIVLNDLPSPAIIESIKNGASEFGLTYTSYQDDEIEFMPLLEDKLVVICHPSHEIASWPSCSLKDIARFDMIALAPSSGNRLLIDSVLSKMDVRLRVGCEVRHVTAMFSLVAASIGIGIAPKFSIPAAGNPLITSVPLVNPEITRTLGIMKYRNIKLTPNARRLYDFFIEEI